jgi:hypothetical protein
MKYLSMSNEIFDEMGAVKNDTVNRDAHGNVFQLFFSLFFSLFLLPTQIFLQQKQTKNEMKNK